VEGGADRESYAGVETMLCFANVAVHVNDDYQVIFREHAIRTFHGSGSSSSGRLPFHLQRADFTKGVDVSWYKNHIQANSIFA